MTEQYGAAMLGSRTSIFHRAYGWTTVRPLGKWRRCDECQCLVQGRKAVLDHNEMHEIMEQYLAGNGAEGEQDASNEGPDRAGNGTSSGADQGENQREWRVG